MQHSAILVRFRGRPQNHLHKSTAVTHPVALEQEGLRVRVGGAARRVHRRLELVPGARRGNVQKPRHGRAPEYPRKRRAPEYPRKRRSLAVTGSLQVRRKRRSTPDLSHTVNQAVQYGPVSLVRGVGLSDPIRVNAPKSCRGRREGAAPVSLVEVEGELLQQPPDWSVSGGRPHHLLPPPPPSLTPTASTTTPQTWRQ